MSAFAADRQISDMIERTARPPLPSITARPSAAERARFRELGVFRTFCDVTDLLGTSQDRGNQARVGIEG